MKVTADTNVLVRLVTGDDQSQAVAAMKALKGASLIAISVRSLCELTWVLSGQYAVARKHIGVCIRGLIESEKVVVDQASVNAGLTFLEASGDFADGVIAFEGRWLGGDTFLSFDQKAIKMLERQGASARLVK